MKTNKAFSSQSVIVALVSCLWILPFVWLVYDFNQLQFAIKAINRGYLTTPNGLLLNYDQAKNVISLFIVFLAAGIAILEWRSHGVLRRQSIAQDGRSRQSGISVQRVFWGLRMLVWFGGLLPLRALMVHFLQVTRNVDHIPGHGPDDFFNTALCVKEVSNGQILFIAIWLVCFFVFMVYRYSVACLSAAKE